MATTLNPARPFPGAGVYPLDAGHFDEAFAKTGTARPPYATVIDALARHTRVELRERVRSNIEEIGLSFGPGVPMVVDPVPRVIDAAEWEPLEAGLLQRARALNAFLLDAYGDQRIFHDGIVPWRLLETSQGYEPRMRGLLDPAVPPATVAGMDLIRDADGELLVLEDNLRMPSGATYAIAVREAIGPEFGAEATARLRAPDGYVARLGEAIRAAAPAAHAAEPVAAILSDGPESGAYYEHERLGRELALPVVTPAQLSAARGRLHAQVGHKRLQLDVVYRRLDEDRLTDKGGSLTPLGRLLAPALESGRLRMVNAIGTGLADDKLAHAYVEAMIRYYLGEQPQLRPLRPGGARRGDGPARRAGDQAARRLRRPRRDDHAARHRGRPAQGDRPRPPPPGALRRPGAGAPLHPPDHRRRFDRAAPRRPAALRRQPGRRRGVGDAGRAHPLRRGGRRGGRQQLTGRRVEGDLGPRHRPSGPRMKLRSLASREHRPLIGVTTSEVRPKERVNPVPEGEPLGKEMALGTTYLKAIEEAGGLPVVMPPMGEDAIEPLLDRLDGICLSGGPDLDPALYEAKPHPELGPIEPELDRFELAIAARADAREMPILAICRGTQALNIVRGGALHQHLPDLSEELAHRQTNPGTEPSHPVKVDPDSQLAAVRGGDELEIDDGH